MSAHREPDIVADYLVAYQRNERLIVVVIHIREIG